MFCSSLSSSISKASSHIIVSEIYVHPPIL
jgi:hypothetical protein